MYVGDDRNIIDLTSLRMREATITTGIWLSAGVGALGEVYVILTMHRPHRAALAVLLGMAIMAAVLVSMLPHKRIVRSRYREAFFLTWTVLDLILIVLGTLADGGTGSSLVLLFILPVIFSSMSYPLVSVAAVGIGTVISYLVIAISAGGASATYEGAFSLVLLSATAMSGWQALNHNRQHQALAEVSRADPLTGCLNRRGFEERAHAELKAAARGGRGAAVLVLDIDHFKQVNDRLGHAAGDELLRWVVHTLGPVIRPMDALGRLGGDEFAILFPHIQPAAARASAVRVAEALSKRAPASIGLATFPLDGTTLEQLTRQADLRLYASRRERPSGEGDHAASNRLSWATTLARAVDLRMDAEHEHSRVVAEYAVAIAAQLGWGEEALGTLRIAAMFHDVGKVGVADEILRKPGPLTEEEFEVIKKHSVTGAELISHVEGLDEIVPWIRHSHESFDGSGYPDGLAGEQIPLASRIMLVADAFDAITSPRPYRSARSFAFACDELGRHAGSQFDPACVRALLKHLNANAEASTPWLVSDTIRAGGGEPAATTGRALHGP